MTRDVKANDGGRRSLIRGCVLAALAVVALAAVGVRAGDAEARSAKPWTRTVQLRLSPRQLGLPASASPRRLARAALSRSAGGLGLSRPLAGVRLESDQRVLPGPRGGVALHSLRFRQTSGGRRVLWSEIVVTIGARKVRSITATVVPVKAGLAAARPRISMARALAIAHRVVAGREAANLPQLVAYAGNPARGRAPRLAYVIETLGAVAKGDDAPTGICVVLDARTGRVLTTWKGNAAPSPARHGGRSAGARAAQVKARAAQVNLRQSVTLEVNDAQKPAPPPTSQDPPRFGIEIGSHYGFWAATGSSRSSPAYTLANWDTVPTSTPRSGSAGFQPGLDAVLRNAKDVVVHMCFTGDFCSSDGRSRSKGGGWPAFAVTGNDSDLNNNNYRAFLERVFLSPTGGYQNDAIAHELGHHIDYIRSGDARTGTNQEQEVREGIADMFAYDFDREDATLLEDGPAGKNTRTPIRNWATSILGQPFRMADYRCGAEIHFNSTILSHAYYGFVQKMGPDVAGYVLYRVPRALGANGTFVNVANTFVSQATGAYPNNPEVAAAARQAFLVEGGITQGPPLCSPAAPPPPPPPPPPAPASQVAVPDVRGGSPGAASSQTSGSTSAPSGASSTTRATTSETCCLRPRALAPWSRPEPRWTSRSGRCLCPRAPVHDPRDSLAGPSRIKGDVWLVWLRCQHRVAVRPPGIFRDTAPKRRSSDLPPGRATSSASPHKLR